MAGATVEVRAESALLRRALAGLVTAGVDLRDPFEEIGSALLSSTQQRFLDEETPEGEDWEPLAESTQQRWVTKRRQRGADNILRQRGHLFASLTYLASKTQVAVGANRVQAALHQFGGEADMPPGPAAVPARPYLGISSDDEREIGEILLDHLRAAMRS